MEQDQKESEDAKARTKVAQDKKDADKAADKAECAAQGRANDALTPAQAEKPIEKHNKAAAKAAQKAAAAEAKCSGSLFFVISKTLVFNIFWEMHMYMYISMCIWVGCGFLLDN